MHNHGDLGRELALDVLHETAQVRDLRRELKKLEAILVEAHNQVQDKARQVEQMREIVAKKD